VPSRPQQDEDGLKSYYQNTREEMLAYVPSSAGRVLEVGCGEGGFGSRLKELRGCEVWGVEVDAAAAARASLRLDRVICGDVGQLMSKVPEHHFDAIVFNDVLEHLVDPWAVVRVARSRLDDGGVVVSSIPNIRHYPTMARLLLRKAWEYEDSGILDRTHLRFFTEKSVRLMYERLGYDILRHEGVNPVPGRRLAYRVANLLARGPVSDMRFLQFATVAQPREG
jgi:2-polyprenyl-3-methyl-5-hydroxy-6-metoxy-1,4-benzoquinol methylase